MGLEYRGERVSDPQDIIRLLDARTTAQEVTDPGDAQAVIDAGITPLANKTYVDSAFNGRATHADVTNAYSNRVPRTALDQTVAQLNGDGMIKPANLPAMTTRGAVWVKGGAVNQRLDVSASPATLSSVWVNYAWMGNQPYHVMPFAQIEVKGNFNGANPQLMLTTLQSNTVSSLALGYGIPSWRDYYHMTMLPTSPNLQGAYTYSSGGWFYLTCRGWGGISCDFTSYLPDWGLLLIPAAA